MTLQAPTINRSDVPNEPPPGGAKAQVWTVVFSFRALTVPAHFSTALCSALGAFDPDAVCIVDGNHVKVVVAVSAPSAFDARSRIDAELTDALPDCGLSPLEISGTQVLIESETKVQARLEVALSEFVGVSEIAAMLGTSRQRASQVSKSEAFPPPAFRLRATPVWRIRDVVSYLRSHRGRTQV